MRATLETFLIFLRLGMTSFGGPVAHLGYFREAFVVQRKWMSDDAYSELIDLCQFLPGPASSQVGMAVGLNRAGIPGMIAAWVGFTLPSALIMAAAGVGIVSLGSDLPAGLLQGLKVAALAVVAQAAWQVGRSLAPDVMRATFAILAAILILVTPFVWAPVAVIAIAGAAGRFLLIGLPLLAATGEGAIQLADTSYRAGSPVFGGGHVVLPLLEAETVPALTDQQTFMAGYGRGTGRPRSAFHVWLLSGRGSHGMAGGARCHPRYFPPFVSVGPGRIIHLVPGA